MVEYDGILFNLTEWWLLMEFDWMVEIYISILWLNGSDLGELKQIVVTLHINYEYIFAF